MITRVAPAGSVTLEAFADAPAVPPAQPELRSLLAARPPFSHERIEIQHPAMEPEDLDRYGMRNEVLITSTAGDLPQQVDASEVRREREIQPGFERLDVQTKWQPRGSAAKIRVVRPERLHEPGEVLIAASINHVQILSTARRAVRRGRHAADQDELHVGGRQSSQQVSEARHAVAPSLHAALPESAQIPRVPGAVLPRSAGATPQAESYRGRACTLR